MVEGRRALLVATYTHQDPALRELQAPAHDAEALAAVLADPQLAGFDVTMSINDPHHVVGEKIGEFYAGCRRDDLALLYFTGHGLKDDAGRLFFASTNTRRTSLTFTAISATQIDDAMENCPSRRKVLVLDCCYSGAFPAGVVAKNDPEVHTLGRFQGRGRAVLTASDATQYSFEGSRVSGTGGASVFTKHLVEGIRTGAADLDGDGDVSLDELYDYVREQVVQEMPQQRPKKQQDVDGRIVISHNPHWTVPSHVRFALDSPFAAQRQFAVGELGRLHRIGGPVVRSRVRAEIESLVDDDSRTVSAAAAALLRGLDAADPPPAPAPPTRPAPVAEQPPAEQPEAAEAEVPETEEPAPESPVAVAAEEQPRREPALRATEKRAAPLAPPRPAPASGTTQTADLDGGPAAAGGGDVRDDSRWWFAGLLTAAVALLLLAYSQPLLTVTASHYSTADFGLIVMWWGGIVAPAVIAVVLSSVDRAAQVWVGLAVGVAASVVLNLLTIPLFWVGPGRPIGVPGLGFGLFLLVVVVLVALSRVRLRQMSPGRLSLLHGGWPGWAVGGLSACLVAAVGSASLLRSSDAVLDVLPDALLSVVLLAAALVAANRQAATPYRDVALYTVVVLALGLVLFLVDILVRGDVSPRHVVMATAAVATVAICVAVRRPWRLPEPG